MTEKEEEEEEEDDDEKIGKSRVRKNCSSGNAKIPISLKGKISVQALFSGCARIEEFVSTK